MATPHRARKANNPNRSGLDAGSTANSLNFSESEWWGRIFTSNESTDSNCYRFVGGARWEII